MSLLFITKMYRETERQTHSHGQCSKVLLLPLNIPPLRKRECRQMSPLFRSLLLLLLPLPPSWSILLHILNYDHGVQRVHRVRAARSRGEEGRGGVGGRWERREEVVTEGRRRSVLTLLLMCRKEMICEREGGGREDRGREKRRREGGGGGGRG